MSKRLDMLSTLIEKGSVDPFVWYARAMELRTLDRLEEALSAYAEVETRFPDYVPTYLMAGQAAELAKRMDEARQWYQRGLDAARRAQDAHASAELNAALAALDH